MNKTPFNTNSLFLKFSKAMKEKKYLEAKNLLEKILSINPNIFEANHNLAILNLQIGDIDNSILYFEKSKKLNPKFPQLYFNLALAYDKKGEVDQAINNFKKVAELDSNNSLSLYNIGHLYVKKMDIDNAENYLQKSLELNPNFILAYHELFGLFDRSNQLEKYKDLLNKLKKKLDDKSIVNFYSAFYEYRKKNYQVTIEILKDLDLEEKYFHQIVVKHGILAKSYDKIKKFDEAYYQYKINNDLVNKYYGKDIEEKNFLKYVNNRIDFFKDFNLNNWNISKERSEFSDPIFLIGFPRSGTTLLDTILRTNKSVEVIEEKPIIKNFLINIEKKTNNDLSQLSNLDKEYIKKMQNFYFAERKKYQKNKNSKIIIDKMPLNIIHIGEILRFFPNAKFVFALRNPYDCVLSCFMQQFQLNPAMKNFLSINSSAILYDLVMQLWSIYRKIFSINCHFIKYEDTVLNFEKTTKDIYKFLDIIWSEETKNFYKTGKDRLDITTPSYDQVTSPLYSKSVNRWKNYEKEFKGVKKLLDRWVNEFGYKV
jgi:tetratricopeptide (TPR) repeat protein